MLWPYYLSSPGAIKSCSSLRSRWHICSVALVRLLLTGSGSWSNTLQSNPPCLQHQYYCLLATYTGSKGPKAAADNQLLVGMTDSYQDQLVERYTSTKCGLCFLHLPFAWSSRVINLSLVCSMLFLYWLIIRHYPMLLAYKILIL